MILPAGVEHCSLEPRRVGKTARVTLNANIGSSQTTSEIGAELGELRASVKRGANTVVGLSSDGDTLWEPTPTASALPSRIFALRFVPRA